MKYLNEYAAYHQNPKNRKIHMVGIPLIVFGLLGMLDYAVLFKVLGFPLTLGTVLLVGANVFYLSLHKKLGVMMLLVTTAIYIASIQFIFSINLVLFLAGWALQLYGHKVHEKKAPAFIDNFIHVLIGPIFILNEFVKVEPITLSEST